MGTVDGRSSWYAGTLLEACSTHNSHATHNSEDNDDTKFFIHRASSPASTVKAVSFVDPPDCLWFCTPRMRALSGISRCSHGLNGYCHVCLCWSPGYSAGTA